MLAVEFGRRAGLAAGPRGARAVRRSGRRPQSPEPIDAVGYLSRATVFVLVGWVTGQMADRLRKVNERVEAGARYFELSRDLLCTASFDGYMTHLNGELGAGALGWTPEELMARPFLDFVHPDDREHTEREAAALGTTGYFTASFTNRYRTKDGGYRWIEWSSRADPEAQLIYAAARDVTERREAEQAQREAEERFRRAFEDSAVGMAVVGIAGPKENLILAGEREPGRDHRHARSRSSWARPTLRDLADPEDVERVAEGMRELDEGEPALVRCEFRIRRPGRPPGVGGPHDLARAGGGRSPRSTGSRRSWTSTRASGRPSSSSTSRTTTPSAACSTGAASSRSSSASSATPPPAAAAAPCS